MVRVSNVARYDFGDSVGDRLSTDSSTIAFYRLNRPYIQTVAVFTLKDLSCHNLDGTLRQH